MLCHNLVRYMRVVNFLGENAWHVNDTYRKIFYSQASIYFFHAQACPGLSLDVDGVICTAIEFNDHGTDGRYRLKQTITSHSHHPRKKSDDWTAKLLSITSEQSIEWSDARPCCFYDRTGRRGFGRSLHHRCNGRHEIKWVHGKGVLVIKMWFAIIWVSQ